MARHTQRRTTAQQGHEAKLAPADMLCFAVYAASHAFTRFYKPLLDPLGLTYPQFLVIAALGRADQQTVSDIGAQLLLDSGTVTPLLKRLQASGLITRQRDAQDERQVRVALTGAGRELLAKMPGVHACVVAALGQNAESIHGLKAEIDSLRHALEAAAA